MKKWYKSKTVWANLLGLVVALGVDLTGEQIGAILVIVNLILRIVTKEELVW